MKHYYFIFLLTSIDGHLGIFHNLDVVNSVMINTDMQEFLLYTDFDTFECIHYIGLV
jgi:hypothetical protein